MSVATGTRLKSFVLLPIGGRKFALAAESVIELVAPGKLQQFPHATPWIAGVIVRRGRVVPVCDVSRFFSETNASLGRFYLIAEWCANGVQDWCAIPVAGECELATGEAIEKASAGDDTPSFFTGVLPVGEDRVEILDIAKLIHEHQVARDAPSPEPAS